MGATASCGPRRVRVADEQTEVVTTQLTESTRHKPLTKVGEFRIGKLLGRGAFGAVYEGIDANGRLVAIKVLDKSLLKRRASMTRGPNPLLDGVKREIAVMKQIRHPNCVHLFAVIDDPEGDRIFLVMEKLSGGEVMAPENLPVGSTHLTIAAARAVFRDLLLGLEYLHGNGILHRDIKPENLVFIERPSARYLDPHGSSHHSRSHREGRSLSPINHFKRASQRDRSESPGFKRMTMGDSHGDNSFGDEEVLPPRVKLLDFGVAMLCEVSSSEGDGKAKANDSIEKSAGTPAFFAPEMCVKGTYRGRPADLWGCGVTLCMLVCGKPPFESDNMPGLFEKIQKGDPTLPIGISPSLRSLLYMLLRKSPDARPTVQALRNDDWVTNGGIEPMDEQLSTTIDLSEDDIKRAMFDLSVGMHVFRVKGKLSRYGVCSVSSAFVAQRWHGDGGGALRLVDWPFHLVRVLRVLSDGANERATFSALVECARTFDAIVAERVESSKRALPLSPDEGLLVVACWLRGDVAPRFGQRRRFLVVGKVGINLCRALSDALIA